MGRNGGGHKEEKGRYEERRTTGKIKRTACYKIKIPAHGLFLFLRSDDLSTRTYPDTQVFTCPDYRFLNHPVLFCTRLISHCSVEIW